MRCSTTLVCVFALTSLAADTPQTALLVLNKGDNALAIVDPKSNQIVGRVPTGDNPHEVAVSSDGKWAFATNYGARGNTITAIDLVAQKGHAVALNSLQRPHGVFFADGKVFFTAEGSRAIGQLDPKTERVDWTFSTDQNGTHMVAVRADNNRIYTANIGSNSIGIIDRAGEKWTQTLVSAGGGPEGFDISPDGKQLWTGHSQDGGVTIIDLATRKVTQTMPGVGARLNRLKFTRDGKNVLVSDYSSGNVIVLDAASHKEVKRLKLGGSVTGILIPPTGDRAYAAVSSDGEVAIIDLKSWAVTGRIKTGNDPDGMAWAERK
jgi:YVTN family beta-propeller protein